MVARPTGQTEKSTAVSSALLFVLFAGLLAIVWGMAIGHWWLVLAGTVAYGLVLFANRDQPRQPNQSGGGSNDAVKLDFGDDGGD
jgi:hypothetical protein